MSAQPNNARQAAVTDTDRFAADHHDEIAAKLAAGRDQIARGQAEPLEPLEELLRDARALR